MWTSIKRSPHDVFFCSSSRFMGLNSSMYWHYKMATAERERLLQRARIPPTHFFRDTEHVHYTRFDSDGIPTHVLNPDTRVEEALSQNQRRGLTKMWRHQKKLHEWYLRQQHTQNPWINPWTDIDPSNILTGRRRRRALNYRDIQESRREHGVFEL